MCTCFVRGSVWSGVTPPRRAGALWQVVVRSHQHHQPAVRCARGAQLARVRPFLADRGGQSSRSKTATHGADELQGGRPRGRRGGAESERAAYSIGPYARLSVPLRHLRPSPGTLAAMRSPPRRLDGNVRLSGPPEVERSNGADKPFSEPLRQLMSPLAYPEERRSRGRSDKGERRRFTR